MIDLNDYFDALFIKANCLLKTVDHFQALNFTAWRLHIEVKLYKSLVSYATIANRDDLSVVNKEWEQ